jgi:type III pantothenate kinase
MILDVDMGNSRLKWRLLDHNKICDSGIAPNAKVMDYAAIFEAIKKPKLIRVSCVKHGLREAFQQWCLSYWQLAPAFAQVSRSCTGVTNGYDNIDQMGVDRWLAMLAAYSKHANSCLVVDMGTAMTIDLLLADGQHVGGYITPGFELMHSALMDGTEIRQGVEIDSSEIRDLYRVMPKPIRYYENPVAGKSTEDAIYAGISALQLGHILLALDELCTLCGDNPSVICTGGGGEALPKSLKERLSGHSTVKKVHSIEFMPTLVLDGLPLAEF